MARSRVFTVVAFIVAIGAAFTAYIFMDQIARLTATAAAGRSAVWVYTPHVSPGDVLAIEVVVKGGKRLGIEDVVVTAGERVLRLRGEGATWGDYLTTRTRDVGRDDVELAIEVPHDAAIDSELPLTVEVSWVSAQTTGSGSFSNVRGTDRIRIPISVGSPGMQNMRRFSSAAFALVLLTLVCVAFAFGGRTLWPILNRPASTGDTAAEAFAVLLIVGLMGYAFVGYGWFALPLVAATEIVGTWFTVLAVLVWLLLPAYFAVKLARRTKRYVPAGLRAVFLADDAPYRTSAISVDRVPDRTPAPRPLSEVVAAIRSAGMTVVERRWGCEVRSENDRLQIRVPSHEQVVPEAMRVDTTFYDLTIDVAVALVPVFGPLGCQTGVIGELIVDGRRDRDALRAEVHAQVRALAEEMLARFR